MSERNVPDVLIEQYFLGELSPEQAAEVERSEGFERRIALIRRENEAFAEQFPAEVYARRIRNQYERAAPSAGHEPARASRRSRTVRILALAMPGVAALLVVGLVIFGGIDAGIAPVADQTAEITRLRGAEPGISLYRAVPGRGAAEPLADGDVAREGDVVQVAYNAAGAPYGVIVSIDGRGTVTLHHPIDPSDRPSLMPGSQPLPRAYQLDDAPAFEVFSFITSETPFDVPELLDRIGQQAPDIASGRSGSLEVPPGFEAMSVTIRKGE